MHSTVYKFLGKTLYELLNGKKPDVSFFRVFGAPLSSSADIT